MDVKATELTTGTRWRGNDLVANSTPVFFLRDPAKFPYFIHTQKRDPSTHLSSGDVSTMFWDYLCNNLESVHQVMVLLGDRGIPDGYRHMHGYSGYTFKFVNAAGEWVYVQIHMKSMQGARFITQEDSVKLSPDYSQKDLYEAIARGDFPRWSVEIQTMTEQQGEEVWARQGINVLDLTHVWPQGQFPRRKVGEFTLNENTVNYFAEIEEAAFNPAHQPPGIEPSADPVLQSRLFSYPDTHRHRIGVNYQQLPGQRTAHRLLAGQLPARRRHGLLQPGRPVQLPVVDRPRAVPQPQLRPAQGARVVLLERRHPVPVGDPARGLQRAAGAVAEGVGRAGAAALC